MDRAAHYRDKANRALRLAEAAWQPELKDRLCVHQIQMSPSLPFTNVTGVGRRRERSARPPPD